VPELQAIVAQMQSGCSVKRKQRKGKQSKKGKKGQGTTKRR
jgi:hypothetical protein